MHGCSSVTSSTYLREGEKSLARSRPDLARQAFQRAADFSHNDPDVLLRIAYIYARSGSKPAAMEWLVRTDKARPDIAHRTAMADLYLQLKDLPMACAEYEKAARSAPKDGVLLNNYVYSCMVVPRKDLDGAIPLLERALALAGRRAFIVDSLGWAYYQRHQQTKDAGDIVKAVDLLTEAVEKDPRNPEERLHLGKAHAARSDWNAAYVELNKALALNPDMPEARAILNRVNVSRRRSERR